MSGTTHYNPDGSTTFFPVNQTSVNPAKTTRFDRNEVLFSITLGDLIDEYTDQLGRELNDDEIAAAKRAFKLLVDDTDFGSIYDHVSDEVDPYIEDLDLE